MSGGRNTGTVPKTKHNTRTRREAPVNHIPNNLEIHGWPVDFRSRRVRKESNNYAPHSDADRGINYDLWSGLLDSSNRTDDEEVHWSNVKSSNITPERGSADGTCSRREPIQRPDNHIGMDERHMPDSMKLADLTRGRLEVSVKLEETEKKMKELHQAAWMSLRNKAIQQVNPMQQMEENQPPMRKAVQQVKPVQSEIGKMGNLNERLDEHANMMQLLNEALENGNEGPVDQQLRNRIDQQLRNKFDELITKKAQCDKILSCVEADNADAAGSQSSEEGEAGTTQFEVIEGSNGLDIDESRQKSEGNQWSEGPGLRDISKQDNRELDHMEAIAAFIESKEIKLEEVKNKFEQLQTLMNRVERLRDIKMVQERRTTEDRSTSHMKTEDQQKNSIPPKLRMNQKIESPQLRHQRGFPTVDLTGYQNLFQMQNTGWMNTLNGPTNSGESTDDGEWECDESPVKLSSSSLPSVNRRSIPNIPNGPPLIKTPPVRQEPLVIARSRNRRSRNMANDISNPNNTTLAMQINQLQFQMEQMQIMCQNIMQKDTPMTQPQPWLTSPQMQTNMGFMQYPNPPGSQWNQHQILVNSLNQCCQLICLQQRELSALRQALAMLQEESNNMYKCGGYGNNLNFESGLLWPQSSPQTLNNQVPPGNRANNYWDNFRSYSRQNLLSGRNKSNEGSITESFPNVGTPQPHTLSDNSWNRRKDNSSTSSMRGNTSSMSQIQSQLPGSERNNSKEKQRRRNSGLNRKPEPSIPSVSLEQSIYYELGSVMSEAEQNPQLLLQLLTHLKNLRSHGSYDENTTFENNEIQGPTFTGNVQQTPRYDKGLNGKSAMLSEVSRLMEWNHICTPEFLQQVVSIVSCNERANEHVTRLEAALLKFQGSRMSDVGDALLWEIFNVVSSYQFIHKKSQPIDIRGNHLPEEIAEVDAELEGAVGGVPLINSNLQISVETELAEADQNSTDNAEALWGMDEAGMENQDIENTEITREDIDSTVGNIMNF